MVTQEWLDGEPVVTLKKYQNRGWITWNPHFSDPSYGDLADTYILGNLGDKLAIRVRYLYDDNYSNDYNTYRVRFEKWISNAWQEFLFYETTASDFGNPAHHTSGQMDKLFEVLADDSEIKWRLSAEVRVNESLESAGNWMLEKKVFHIQVRQLRRCCCR